MKTLAIICFQLVFLAAIVYPQKSKGGLETQITVVKPNFSGRWQLNVSRSRFDKNSYPELITAFHVVIDHQDPMFSVLVANAKDPAPSKESAAADFIWYTDGRGNEWNATFENATTVTKWEARKLITNHYDNHAKTNVVQLEEIEMEPDTNTLKVLFKRYYFRSPERTMKNVGYTAMDYLVFDRVN